MAKLYGKGSIEEKVKGKKYRIRFSVGKNPITGKYDMHTETFMGTRRQAELRVEELRKQYESGRALRADEITFSEWCERFLSGREGLGKLKPATLKQNRNTSKHLLRYLGDVKVSDIAPVNVTDMYAAMRGDGVGDATILHCHKLMKQIMRSAVDNDICLRNPMDRVDAPKKPKPKREALSTDESRRLASIVTESEPSANATAVYIALATGARLGEVLGLTWDDVHTEGERPYIYFIKQLTREGKLSSLKTDAEDNPVGRVVPIDGSTVGVLERWRDAQAKALKELAVKQTGDTHVITNGLGNHCDHTHFTHRLADGMDIPTAQALGGWSTPTMLMTTYAHPVSENVWASAGFMDTLTNGKEGDDAKRF